MKLLSLFSCLILTILHGTCSSELLSTSAPETSLRSFGNGFWNVRVPFQLNEFEIGSHMSLIQLENGKFLVIDTVVINDQLKSELDELTDNGTKIEAVLAVHPFHTLAYSAFNKLYPDLKYYGTPRHLRKLTEIKWAGQLDDVENKQLLSKWGPEIELRIPAGAEYFNPQPELTNHFVSVFVYHPASKTLHVDDTLIYLKGTVSFHPSMMTDGLYPTAEAPLQFRDWMKQMLADWDFDNLCAAHMGIQAGGAHAAVQELVNNSEKLFLDLSERNKNNESNLTKSTS